MSTKQIAPSDRARKDLATKFYQYACRLTSVSPEKNSLLLWNSELCVVTLRPGHYVISIRKVGFNKGIGDPNRSQLARQRRSKLCATTGWLDIGINYSNGRFGETLKTRIQPLPR
jgi:hypothetical protein